MSTTAVEIPGYVAGQVRRRSAAAGGCCSWSVIATYGTRAEPFLHGSRLALRTHTERILQLGQEYPSRLPDWIQTDSLPARKGLPGRGGPTARAVTRDQEH